MFLSTIPSQYRFLGRTEESFTFGFVFFLNDGCGGRVCVEVNVVSAGRGLPGEELELLNRGGIARVTVEIVSGEAGLGG